MHSNTESGREEHGAVGRKSAAVKKASTTHSEPQLADTITGKRASAGLADTRFADKESDDGRRLSPEREAQIRQRVLDGTYNSLSMVDEVARRIIRSTDL